MNRLFTLITLASLIPGVLALIWVVTLMTGLYQTQSTGQWVQP